MTEPKLAAYSEVSDYYDKLWSELDEKKLGGINSRHRLDLLQKIYPQEKLPVLTSVLKPLKWQNAGI